MLNRLRRSPYDLRPLRRSPAQPDPLVHSRPVARPVMAAYAAVYTDGEMLFDLPPDLDPELRDLFGEESILDGDFTRGLRVARDHPSTDRLQSAWGDVLGRLAAADDGIWAEIQLSQARRPWVHAAGRTVRFGAGGGALRDCAQDIGTVVDIEPGMAALGILHDLIRSRRPFRYWVITRHAFIGQMVHAYENRRLPARTLRCLRGAPADVLRDLAVRERRSADLVIWGRAAERNLAATLRQAWNLLRPRGVLLLGLPSETRLPAPEADGFDIEAPDSDGPCTYLWMTRTA
jgi:hypothetical protein